MQPVTFAAPPAEIGAWLERRRALGQDRFDEVWEGEYHVAPMAHSHHGAVADEVAAALRPRARRAGLTNSGPVNLGVADDYRVPDHVVLHERHGAVYVTTAAIVVEVVSPGDESRSKLNFYFARGVAEVLIVDPHTQAVEWYRRGTDGFERRDASALLGVTEAELHAEVDWP
jgi:Uma2 family endonuclease